MEQETISTIYPVFGKVESIIPSDNGDLTVRILTGSSGEALRTIHSQKEDCLNMANLCVGDYIFAAGHRRDSDAPGIFSAVAMYKVNADTLTETVKKYITGLHIPGFGEKSIDKFIALFGDRAMMTLLYAPVELEKVSKNFGKKEFVDSLKECIQRDRSKCIDSFWLMQYGLSKYMADKVYSNLSADQYFRGDILEGEAIRKIAANPYCLTSVPGFGFVKTDSVALSMGISPDSPYRIIAAIYYAVSEFENKGNTCIPQKQLLDYVLAKLLMMPKEKYAEVQSLFYSHVARADLKNPNGLTIEKKIISEKLTEEIVYRNKLLWAEKGIADSIAMRLRGEYPLGMQRNADDDFFRFLNGSTGIEYQDKQLKAIKTAIAPENPIFVLTGGPGTGKTTTVSGIISATTYCYGLEKDDVCLLAPTGKAANRLKEQTGYEASTIHSRLGLNPETGLPSRKIDEKLVVVDELGMIDTELFNTLLKSVSPSSRLVFSGDYDQLQSVLPGRCLRDLLESGTIPHVQLERIYRQGKDSDIINIANDIRNGLIPNMEKFSYNVGEEIGKKSNVHFIHIDNKYKTEPDYARTQNEIHEKIIALVEHLHNMGYSANDIQILSPSKSTSKTVENQTSYQMKASTYHLNPSLKEIFNPLYATQKPDEQKFRPGDKVILTKNLNQKKIYNGDQGYVNMVLDNGGCRVSFENEVVELDKQESEYLELSYAVTVHKSQGSEFKFVVIPLDLGMGGLLLNREMIYTAITRAKEQVILVGTNEAIEFAITNYHEEARYSNLQERLRGLLPQKFPFKQTKAHILNENAQPMVQEEHIPTLQKVLSVPEKETLKAIVSAMQKVGIDVHYRSNGEALQDMDNIAEAQKIRFNGRRNYSKDEMKILDKGVFNAGLANRLLAITDITTYSEKPGQDKTLVELKKELRSEQMSGVWIAHQHEAGQYFYRVPVSLLDTTVCNNKKAGTAGQFELRIAIYRSLPILMENAVDSYIQSRGHYDLSYMSHVMTSVIKYDQSYYRVDLMCESGDRAFSIMDFEVREIHPRCTRSEEISTPFIEFTTGASVFSAGELRRSPEASTNYGELFLNEFSSHRTQLYGREYGWVDGNSINITQDGLNIHTAIKNYAHLWAKALQIKNPVGWEKIVAIIKGTPEWNGMLHDFFASGAYYNEDFLVAETLSKLTGIQNEKFIENIKGTFRDSGVEILHQELKNASRYFWSWAGQELFEISDFESIDAITNRVLYDLVSSTNILIKDKDIMTESTNNREELRAKDIEHWKNFKISEDNVKNKQQHK